MASFTAGCRRENADGETVEGRSFMNGPDTSEPTEVKVAILTGSMLGTSISLAAFANTAFALTLGLCICGGAASVSYDLLVRLSLAGAAGRDVR